MPLPSDLLTISAGWGSPAAPAAPAATPGPVKRRKTRKNKLYNIPVIEAFSHLLSKKKCDGEVGLEIECEGTYLFDAPISYWRASTDGSLRATGDHPPVEYVLRRPLSRTDIPKALNYLSKKLKEVGSQVADSTRTSVHVHINVQQLTMKQIVQIWCLYVIFEELLVHFSGPDREGNLFCLRAKDAEHAIQNMEQGLKTENYNDIFSEHLRYTSCNTASVSKFGSLEFRSMRGTVDQGLIQLWVDILLLIKDKALEYDNPQKIVRDFEALSPQGFLYKIFSSRQDIFELFVDLPYRNQQMWDGLRLMRDVAYAVKWEKPVPEEKKDPEEKESEFDPVLIREGVYLQYSVEMTAWYLCNWTSSHKTVTVQGRGCPITTMRAICIEPSTGSYQNGPRFDLPHLDLQNPDGDVPVLESEVEEVIIDDIYEEDRDDEF